MNKMKTITRKEAKNLLKQRIVKTFTRYERRAILEELWLFCDKEERFDAEDLAFYPKEIRLEMLAQDAPTNPDDPKYDFIIAERISPNLHMGIRNEYLMKLLQEEGQKVDRVVGENEKLEICVCCNYRTISPGVEGRGESCPVCYWTNASEKANRMSLEQARNNFRAFGAIDRGLLLAIDPDGREKFDRS